MIKFNFFWLNLRKLLLFLLPITGPANFKSRYSDDQDCLIDKTSWPIILEPALEHPITLDFLKVGFPFSISHGCFFGPMSKLNYCYWLEIDDFFKSTARNTEKDLKAWPNVSPYTVSPLWAATPNLSRKEAFAQREVLVKNQDNAYNSISWLVSVTYLEVLIGTMETKTHLLLMKNHQSLKVQCLHHYSLIL